MNFTDKLNLLMEERGITRGKLSEYTGVPYNTIVGFYTKGYKNIKLSTLKKLASFFGVSLDILGDDEAELDDSGQSGSARAFTERYEALSKKGRDIVGGVIDGLLDIQREEEPESEEEEIVYIREYITPAAAGYASPAEGDDYVLKRRTADVPRNADFAVRIDGDSMEPYIKDGSSVYVSRTNILEPGDVGIFFFDGDMKCKQYCEDCYGNIYLFSLNRARSDADAAIMASSGLTVFCFGKVLLDKRPPLPAE